MECSVYVHVPFCRKKCPYCHFYVIPDQERFKQIYMEALRKEWEMRKETLGDVVSVYFGGGTPTLLGPERIGEIVSWMGDAGEITIEANPEDQELEQFRKVGINRLSLGVQSLDDRLLVGIGRQHSAEDCVTRVEEAGFDNISIDLMYDLPGQSVEDWRRTLERAVELPVTHISLYNLTIEPHTAFYKKRPKQPSGEESLAMLEMAVEILESAGFRRYEISAFAKEGCESRHNVGYWTGRPFLGFGPSACSYWEGARFRNCANLNKYAKALKEGRDPCDFREKLSDLEAKKERLAIGLRMLGGVPLETVPKSWLEPLAPWTKIVNGRLQLSPVGLLFHDTVAEKIMDLPSDS